MNVYIDCEFDSIRIGRKFQQCVVSIGAVAEDNGKHVQFYSLIHPAKFRRVSYVVHKITQLNAEDIMKASSFASVMDDFLVWLQQFDEPIHIYSFGPDDRRTLYTHARYEGYKGLQKKIDIKDLQKILSSSVKYNKQSISSILSLDDIKYAYALQGDVIHNALNDAIDLMHLHQLYIKHIATNEQHVQEIWERKEAKRKEVEEKQRLRMLKLLNEKYKQYEGVSYPIKFLPDSIEQLIALEQLQHPCHILYQATSFQYEQKKYSYNQATLHIIWNFTDEKPYVDMNFKMNHKNTCFRIYLNYRNASILECITKTSEVK